MRKGDVVLLHHKLDPLAWLICWLAKSEFNHVAWAINDKEIIESVGKGIIVTPISKYLNWRWNVKILRLKNLSRKQINRITERMLEKRCRYFYLEYLLSFALMILRRKTHRTTCSNFVSYELRKENLYIKKRNYEFIVPEDFNCYKHCINVTQELKR